MKKIFTTLLASVVAAGAIAADHKELTVVGEATLYGWDLGLATAIPATPENDNIYVGTMYLKDSGDFKFLTSPSWGGTEYGAAPGATLVDGTIALAVGTNDTGYGKISVPEAANYLITVNLTDMTATIEKSVYQDTQIRYASLYIIGSLYTPAYGFNEAPVMYQICEEPYKLVAHGTFTAGEFKICTALGGGRDWHQDCFYFRDADDADKMVYNQAGDLKWTLPTDGTYSITANVVDNTLTMSENTQNALINASVEDLAPEYYNLQGMRVDNPHGGVYIVRTAAGTKKVIR